MTHGRVQFHHKSSNGKSQDYIKNEDEDNNDDNSWPKRLVPQERNYSGDTLQILQAKIGTWSKGAAKAAERREKTALERPMC